MKDITKQYTNGEVTIVWQPSLCIHSTMCWKGAAGLPAVFDPSRRPWITPDGADTDAIINQVKKCPSGALSFHMNAASPDNRATNADTVVEALRNGPLLVHGELAVKDSAGNVVQKSNVTAFCRCGASQNKPYCDGSHARNGFEG